MGHWLFCLRMSGSLSIIKLTCPSSLSPADIRLTLAISASGVIVSMSSVLFCTNKGEHPFELITDTVFLTGTTLSNAKLDFVDSQLWHLRLSSHSSRGVKRISLPVSWVPSVTFTWITALDLGAI